MTLTFNNDTGDCGDLLVPPSFPGGADLSGVFATTCVLYSNDLPSEWYHQHHGFRLYGNSTN